MKKRIPKKLLSISLAVLTLMSVTAISIMSATSAEHLRGDLSVIRTESWNNKN